MGNTKSNQPSCMNETVAVNIPPTIKGDGCKTGEPTVEIKKNTTNVERTTVSTVHTPETSFVASNSAMASLCLEDTEDAQFPKRPQLRMNYNSSSENYSSQLSTLREFEDEKTEVINVEIEYLNVPPAVADFVKPENARKNVMDSFEMIRTLGDGMSSCVFEVKHVPTGERYALKRLRRAQSHSDLLFAGECKFLSVLKCQGVIRTIDAFVDETYFYVLNELGVTDLFKKIKANGKLSEKIAKEVIRHLLETLKELHQTNMVHRDIKPENVVFTDNQSNFPKLIDFGDAIVVKDNKIYTELVGTKCYLAPERLRRHYGWELKASDVWAIGVLAFEMVTGKRCFYGSCDEQVMERIEKGSFKFPELFKPSSLFSHFVHSLLTVDDSHRPTAEFALRHPWLSVSEDVNEQRSLIEAWNSNVAKAFSWTVYKP